MPAARQRRATSCLPTPRVSSSVFMSCLRRIWNEPRMMRNSSASLGTSTGGRSRRRKRTSMLSTSGRGQNAAARTVMSGSNSAWYRANSVSDPYSGVPAAAGTRPGTDLDRHVVLAQVAMVDDAIGQVLANQEVLSESPARGQPALGEHPLQAREPAALERRPLADVARGSPAPRRVGNASRGGHACLTG